MSSATGTTTTTSTDTSSSKAGDLAASSGGSSTSTSTSWVRDSTLTWTQRLAINVLRCGPIPRHVAFIMDGNRRYATKTGMSNKTDGHRLGFDKLTEALQWCLELGIAEATVYAFSIENFKRSADEVDTLMRMATERFEQLLDELDQLHERGICIRIVGNWSLFPRALQRSMARAMLHTQHNRAATLNVAFAYTSRDEATAAICNIAGAVSDEAAAQLRPEDISMELLRNCMYTRRSVEPELLVRTSGESRLSDFMLFQITTTIVYFTDTLWPEFSIWHLLAGIFYYQTQHERMRRARETIRSQAAADAAEADALRTGEETAASALRKEAFLRRFEEHEADRLQALSKA